MSVAECGVRWETGATVHVCDRVDNHCNGALAAVHLCHCGQTIDDLDLLDQLLDLEG